MKKFQLQNLYLNVNKLQINVLSLKSKTDEYILYENISYNNLNDSRFGIIEANESFNITPKKKIQELKIISKYDDKLKKYFLYYKNKNLYYIKNNKNIILDDADFKLILSNGKLYENLIVKNSLVDSILNNSKPKDTNHSSISSANSDLMSVKNIKTESESIYEEPLKIEKDFTIQTNIQTNIQNNLKEGIETKKNIDIVEENIELEDEIIENNIIKDEIIENNIIKDEIIENNIENQSEENSIIKDEIIENNIENIEMEEESITIQDEIEIQEEENSIIKDEIIQSNIENNELENKSITIQDDIENQEEGKNNDKKIIEAIPKEKIMNNDLNLEKIIDDFNKLFSDLDIVDSKKNKIQEKELIKSSINMNVSKNEINNTVNNVKTINTVNNVKTVNTEYKVNINKNETNQIKLSENNYYLKTFNYQNTNYTMFFSKLSESINLNFSNLYNSPIPSFNIINNINLSIELKNENLSYLMLFFNQKYLINKIDNSITLINLNTKKAQIIKNKELFKISNYDYMLYNNCTCFIPMLNKTNFDNYYGTSFNILIPRI